MARKPAKSSSSRPASKKRKIHPKRTGIVWGGFLATMTLAGGALLIGDRWQALPAVKIAPSESPRGGAPVEVAPGRWQAIVIHHSATPAGTAVDLARQHEQWGLGSLGYHFVIGNGNGQADGEVVQGPRWLEQQPGAHVAERAAGATPDAAWFNQNAIGICLIGNGERRAFTESQMKALAALVNDLQRATGIPDANVVLHSDLVATESPGRWFPREQFAIDIAN
ncbi:MAG: peptidoglycan recognition family protein [Planctomycetota bacterium]